MFKKMPVLLLLAISLIGITHQLIPYQVKSYLYAISLLIKSMIIFVLPFLIFGLLFKTAIKLAKKSSKAILVILLAVCLSNLASTLIACSIGVFVYNFDISLTFPESVKKLNPAFLIEFPSLISNSYAMFLGLISGVIMGRLNFKWLEQVTNKVDSIVNVFFKLILLSVPMFIIGFSVQMFHDQVMLNIVKSYFKIFTIIFLSLIVYIGFFYLAVCRFNFRHFFNNLKGMLPGVLTGMASMSSATAMPFTIISVEKNSKESDLAKSIVPATINIHLIGDCFAITIFAFAILKGFDLPLPDFLSCITFAIYFVIAKFSVAAVPGGGVLIMLPILEKYLGFNGTMLSLITALYVLFDPLITGANVFGNGAFSLGLCKFLKKGTRGPAPESTL